MGVLVAAEGAGLGVTESKKAGLGGADPGASLEDTEMTSGDEDGASLEDTEMTSGDEDETEGRGERELLLAVSWSLPVLVGHGDGVCCGLTALVSSSHVELSTVLQSEYTGEVGEKGAVISGAGSLLSSVRNSVGSPTNVLSKRLPLDEPREPSNADAMEPMEREGLASAIPGAGVGAGPAVAESAESTVKDAVSEGCGATGATLLSSQKMPSPTVKVPASSAAVASAEGMGTCETSKISDCVSS
jgi:hypothetical protein